MHIRHVGNWAVLAGVELADGELLPAEITVVDQVELDAAQGRQLAEDLRAAAALLERAA